MQETIKETTKGITPSQTVGPFFAYGLTSNGKYDWNDAFTSNLVTPDASGERIRVEAPADRCYDVAIDFESYPEWVRDVKEAKILETDEERRRFKDAEGRRAVRLSERRAMTKT